jgi:ribosomal RNA-processing protein 12
MSIEDSLAKIRPHTASHIPHQKAPAQLLVAMEDSFEERTSTAYFAATFECLKAQLTSQEEKGLNEGDRLPAILYLFSLILPYTPPPVIRSHLPTISSFLAIIYPSVSEHAPVLRSTLSITGAFLRALDRALLIETHGVKKLFSTLLDYVADGRPKVRKKAAEEVREILGAPPSPMQVHPFANGMLKWAKGRLGCGSESEIHVVSFLRSILPFLHPDTQSSFDVEDLTTHILSLTKIQNPHLEVAVYGLLSDLLSSSASSNQATISTLLNNVPSPMDVQLSSAWTSIFTSLTLPRSDSSPANFLKIFRTISNFLSSKDVTLQRTAADALSGFIHLNFVDQVDLATSEGKAIVDTVLNHLSQALIALPFANALSHSLRVLSTCLACFPYSSVKQRDKGISNDETFRLVSTLIVSVSKLRVSPNFHHKESADRLFVSVYLRWGARRMLELVPLNLEPSER